MLVEDHHDLWVDKLPSIRFAMNSARSISTGFTPAYLTFARELRAEGEVRRDLRAVVQNENFVPEVTPYLLKVAQVLEDARETLQNSQDRTKEQADRKRRPHHEYKEGGRVLVKTHFVSNAAAGKTSKFYPKRDGPYLETKRTSPVSCEIASLTNPEVPLGKYHVSDLTLFRPDPSGEVPQPTRLVRPRGRPKKFPGAASVQPVDSRGGVCNTSPSTPPWSSRLRPRRGSRHENRDV
jgi:hypothetical protein